MRHKTDRLGRRRRQGEKKIAWLWNKTVQLIPYANHVLQGSKTPFDHVRIKIPNTSCLIHKPLHNNWLEIFPVNDKISV